LEAIDGYLGKSLTQPRGRREKSVSLTVFFWFSMAIVLSGPMAQKGGDSAELPPRSDMTSAEEVLVGTLSPVNRPSSWVETSVPLRKPSSIVPSSLSEAYGQRSLVFEANQGQTDGLPPV